MRVQNALEPFLKTNRSSVAPGMVNKGFPRAWLRYCSVFLSRHSGAPENLGILRCAIAHLGSGACATPPPKTKTFRSQDTQIHIRECGRELYLGSCPGGPAFQPPPPRARDGLSAAPVAEAVLLATLAQGSADGPHRTVFCHDDRIGIFGARRHRDQDMAQLSDARGPQVSPGNSRSAACGAGTGSSRGCRGCRAPQIPAARAAP